MVLQTGFFGGTLLHYFYQGGWVMYPLLAISIVSIGFIGERLYVIMFKSKVNTNHLVAHVRKALLARDLRASVQVCEKYRGPVAAILKAGILKYGAPREEVEKTIENSALHELARLERGLAVLASSSNIAPIIGFLGTVVGMIASFDAIASQGLNNPALVAKGISVALITTAGGLIVAVITLPFYNFFTSRIAIFVREMETSANILLETFAEMDQAAPAAKQSAASS
ncbi:MAG: MotA/TolQ/ExbB proton channel family protein [Acidobacteria bacterium]|nr:MotA/TolQ/ExbB proton channel family protein [Acidobacteriota bacterium]MCZ6649112.1 MotA/TolQ/ExbB proton channel family protein [Acidobacteriota bacterium]